MIAAVAPAYDLTYSAGRAVSTTSTSRGEGRNQPPAQLQALGRRYFVPDRVINTVIEEVRAVVDAWPRFADEAGVTRASKAEILAAHAAVSSAFFPSDLTP